MAAPAAGYIDPLGRLSIFMLESFPVIVIIGTVLGFLAGLGVGGGSLLILWLTLILEMDYPQARVLTLLFFLPAAIVSSLFRWKQGKLDFIKILPAILAGCISAALFCWLGFNLDTDRLKKLFGVLLLLTGLRELFYKPKKRKDAAAE